MSARIRAWLDALTLRQRLLGLFAAMVLALLGLMARETATTRAAQEAHDAVAADNLRLRLALARLQQFYADDVGVRWTQHVALGRVSAAHAAAALETALPEARAGWDTVVALARTQPGALGLLQRLPELRAPADAAVERLRQILAAGDQAELMSFFALELDAAMAPLLGRLDDAGNRLNAVEAAHIAEARRRLQVRDLRSYGVVIGACLALFLAARAGTRSLYRGIEDLTRVARRLTARDFSAPPARVTGSELGELARAFETMQQALAHYERELTEREVDARAASHAKSMFLAAMSHEIRTPLIGVLGMLEVLGRTRLDDGQRRQFDIVHQSAQALLEIVGEILDYSKIEAGKVELVPETVGVRELVSRVVSTFSANIAAKGLAITQRVASGVAPAHVADGPRIMQILRNFISNAIKFTERGSVAIAVELLANEEAGQRLAFTVTDTGIGMTPAQLGRVFQPFAQADAGTTRRFGGTGLGLVISRRLAEVMGGSVRAASEAGRGTSVTLEVCLPAGVARDIAEPVPEKHAPVATRIAPTREQASQEGSLILLAEDHPVNREVLTGQLNLAGFCVDTAEDGASALEKFGANRYALVLTDLHMPGLDGFELAAAIRALEQAEGRPRTPIIALTADVVREHVERCFASGMDDYLSKPVTIRRLVQKLQRWMPHVQWSTETGPDAAAPAPAPAPIDENQLAEVCGREPAKARALLQYYCRTAQQDLAALARVPRGGGSELKSIAHRMKGAALMVGAQEVADLSREAEGSGQWSPALDARLREAVARVERYAHDPGTAPLLGVALPESRSGLRPAADV